MNEEHRKTIEYSGKSVYRIYMGIGWSGQSYSLIVCFRKYIIDVPLSFMGLNFFFMVIWNTLLITMAIDKNYLKCFVFVLNVRNIPIGTLGCIDKFWILNLKKKIQSDMRVVRFWETEGPLLNILNLITKLKCSCLPCDCCQPYPEY